MKCSNRCGRKSQGSVGPLRYCRECFAGFVGLQPSDKRLRSVAWFEFTHGRLAWVPDAAISRAREKAATK